MREPLTSLSPGFLSGWYFAANLRYAFLIVCGCGMGGWGASRRKWVRDELGSTNSCVESSDKSTEFRVWTGGHLGVGVPLHSKDLIKVAPGIGNRGQNQCRQQQPHATPGHVIKK
jgi:hypothetical protein